MSIIDYKDPIIPSWRIDENGDKYSKEILNEEHQVIGNKIVLNELPDIKYRVFINENFVEININEEITEENQFKVDYTTGLITVHNSLDGQFITVGKYYGRGIINYPASRVWTETSADGEVTETLKDIIDTNKIYFQEPVDTYAEIATAYPNPQVGWAVQVLNDGENTNKIYRWDGSEWKYINKINISGLQSQIDELENKITDIENQDLNNRISIIENQDLNNRISTIENQDLDNRLTTLENNINSPEYTPEIYNTSSIFTVGQGTDENGNALDYSDSIVNGQVSGVEIEGRTLKNELNYNNETWEEWSLDPGAEADSTGLEFTSTGYFIDAEIPTKLKSNTKYGILVNVLKNETVNFCLIRDIDYATSPVYITNYFTGIFKATFTTGNIVNNILRMFMFDTIPEGHKIKLNELRVFELPQGSEIEWDFENLSADKLAQKYPYIQGDSTKSTVSAIRIKSIGKNMFNGNTEIGTFVLGVPSESTIRARIKDFVRVKQSAQYTIKFPTGYSGATLFYYDINKNYISYENIGINQKTFITPSNANYVTFNIFKGDGTEVITSDDLLILKATQLQEGIAIINDEEYKESTMYLYAEDEEGNIIKLNSLPNGVKDKLYVDTSGYKVRKATGEKYISSSGITSVFNDTNAQIVKFDNLDIDLSHIEWIDAMLIETSLGVFTSYGYNMEYTYYQTGGKLRLCFPLGTFTDLADAKDKLDGSELIYQLAEPNYYELKGVTPLQVFENGTVYVEPFLRKAIKYDTTNGNGFDFPIKISEIEKIEDINGNELDLESVTLATDGMSATCTTANEGEVYTVYAYIDSAENVTPTTVMKLPINSKAQIEGNNKAIQQLGYDIETLQDKIDILILNTFS